MEAPGDQYLAARDAVLDYVRPFRPRKLTLRLRDGSHLRITRRPFPWYFLLQVTCWNPGEDPRRTGGTTFHFWRSGQVTLTGARGVPLRRGLAEGAPVAPRGDLLRLGEQLRSAFQAGPSWRPQG
jgi:hypothetical protein